MTIRLKHNEQNVLHARACRGATSGVGQHFPKTGTGSGGVGQHFPKTGTGSGGGMEIGQILATISALNTATRSGNVVGLTRQV